MTDLDLEAIKARAQAAEDAHPSSWQALKGYGGKASICCGDLREINWPGVYGPIFTEATAAHIAGMDPETTLALLEKIERLQDAWSEAVIFGEWATFQLEETRDRLTITDDMVERAALAIAEVDEWPTNEELGGNLTGVRDEEFRDEYIEMARAALEAALGGYK